METANRDTQKPMSCGVKGREGSTAVLTRARLGAVPDSRMGSSIAVEAISSIINISPLYLQCSLEKFHEKNDYTCDAAGEVMIMRDLSAACEGGLWLHKTKSLSLQSSEDSSPQQRPAGVEGQVETRDAGVGCGQSRVIWRSDGDAGRWLVGLCVGRQCRTAGPEIEQLLPLSHTHPLHHGPEPALEPRQDLLLFLCQGEEKMKERGSRRKWTHCSRPRRQ